MSSCISMKNKTHRKSTTVSLPLHTSKKFRLRAWEVGVRSFIYFYPVLSCNLEYIILRLEPNCLMWKSAVIKYYLPICMCAAVTCRGERRAWLGQRMFQSWHNFNLGSRMSLAFPTNYVTIQTQIYIHTFIKRTLLEVYIKLMSLICVQVL